MTEPTTAELVARARALQPLLREHAAKTDADRRVVTECIDALGEAGLFRVSVPKRYGGYETRLRTMLDVSAAVAEGDGSAGWVLALTNVRSEEHTSELQSRRDLVCRLLPEK